MRKYPALLAAALLAAGISTAAAQDPAYIVVDADNGSVLLHSQSDQPWYPASVTKMMTAYVTFQALKSGRLNLTSPVKISGNALAQAPAKMGFSVGTVMNVDNALKMMLVKSANDIAVAVAETVGGSEPKFVEMMNAEAARLGMASTHFSNPNGLPDSGQVTTARDLAVLARATWVEFPEYREFFRIPAIKAGKRILRSPNRLLEEYRGTTGMKTGFICASGFNIVASAERNGRHLIAVVLGATSSEQRAEAAARLLNQGFASWFGPSKPQLTTFRAVAASGQPVDMREQVCGKRVQQEDDGSGDPVLAKAGDTSALVPRFVLMQPVPVYTGRADLEPGAAAGVVTVKSLPASKMPMPRLRPRNPAETVVNAFAPVPEDPIAIQLDKPN